MSARYFLIPPALLMGGAFVAFFVWAAGKG